ncbi:MAG TPA: DUF1656 domain-containing protein [Desulfobulbus sp.]|nr:DUF1656 domain-containing protein [Desulfobulbus sp.]
MNNYPHELAIGDVYLAPFLPALMVAFMATLVTVMILNKCKLSRFFYAPAYVFIAIMTLYLVLIDTFWIRF